MDSKRDIRYFFPFCVPILLGFSDFFLKLSTSYEVKDSTAIIIEISTLLLFSFFTIDIWGITTTIKKAPTIAMKWVLAMIIHFAIYGFGSYIQKRTFEISQSSEISATSIILPIVLVVISFVTFLCFRENMWKEIQE